MDGPTRELQALCESDQGETYTLTPARSGLPFRLTRQTRGWTVALPVAALLLAAGLCVLAGERRGVHLRAQLSTAVGLDELPEEDENGFDSPEDAFQAEIHKQSGQFTAQDQMMYEAFKRKVDEDRQQAQVEGGHLANVMAQKASEHSSDEVAHTPMQLRQQEQGQGRVAELYTFGAPGTAVDPLYDATSPDGCIAGLRTYTKGVRFSPGVGKMFAVTDPVAYICNGVNLAHPKMESFAVLQYNDLNNSIVPCGQGNFLPHFDGYFWITGHLIYPKLTEWHQEAFPGEQSNLVAPNDLSLNLRRLQEDDAVRKKVEKAHAMAHFTFMNYKATPMISVDAGDWGWHLVGRACAATTQGQFQGVLGLTLKLGSNLQSATQPYLNSCKDHTLLYQHSKSLDCALVFEGSDDLNDWMANLNFGTAQYCGLGFVHNGFRSKVLSMVGGIDYGQVIRPKLKYCNSVTVAGHSLGGAQAELFTACANRMLSKGEQGFADYRLASFTSEGPQHLPRFYEETSKGVFLRNKGTGLCMDIEGTMGTNFASSVILYSCETADAGFTKDQKWKFHTNGLVVNEMSGLCVAPGVVDEKGKQSPLQQVTCDSADAKLQWSLSKMGLLRNEGSGQCVTADLKMDTCPFTDQQFDMQADGHILNKLSKLCIGATQKSGAGSATSGGDIVLVPCANHPRQLWELAADGSIRSKLNGLCMNMQHTQGRSERPSMVLGACSQSSAQTVIWTKFMDGFLRSKVNGKCLDVVGQPGTQVGTGLTINACEDKSIDAGGVWVLMEGGYIRNIGDDENQQYKCLTVSGRPWERDRKAASGNTLALDPCRLVSDQKWEITPKGWIRSTLGGQKCLDVNQYTPAGKLWIMNCEDWTDPILYLDLKWDMRDGELSNRLYQECVAPSPEPGILETVPCEEAKAKTQQQAWNMRADGGVQIGAYCLDVGNPRLLGNPMPLVANSCFQSLADTTQEWELMPHGFLRNRYHSLCTGVEQMAGLLTVPHAVVLKPCPTTTQLWRMLPSGQIQNRASGKCVDAMRNITGTSWWDITEWPCDAGRQEQIWEQVG